MSSQRSASVNLDFKKRRHLCVCECIHLKRLIYNNEDTVSFNNNDHTIK